MANVSKEQKAIVRARILKAARSLFAEQGFQNTTTRAIAEAADVSESSIFTYFGSKDDLLVCIVVPQPPAIERTVAMTTPWHTLATLMRYHFAEVFPLDRRLLREFIAVLQRSPVTSKSDLLERTHAFDMRLISAATRVIDYFGIDEPEVALPMAMGVITSNFMMFTLDPQMTIEEYLARIEAQLEYLLRDRVAVHAEQAASYSQQMQVSI